MFRRHETPVGLKTSTRTARRVECGIKETSLIDRFWRILLI